MQTSKSVRHATTWLTHVFGGGLDQDDRFVVERFESMASGEIRPMHAAKAGGGDQRKAGTTVSRRTVQRLHPKRYEIIIATGVSRDAGIQLYGDGAAGMALRSSWR
ncbi:MAG: hypothetical protein OXK82_02655 [Deltaproteobacteria bacterium]|nr:hypothetical protein [Deltaproteobacteria bacterium]